MLVHLSKKMWGGFSFLFIFMGILAFPQFFYPAGVNADTPALKEMEPVGTRLVTQVFWWRIDKNQPVPVTIYSVKVANVSRDKIYPPIRLVIDSLSVTGVTLQSPSGQMDGKDYIEIPENKVPNGVLLPGETIPNVMLTFLNPQKKIFSFASSYYARMEQEQVALMASGIKPLENLNGMVQLTKLSVRAVLTRKGSEALVRVKNISGERIYGPMRLSVESVSQQGVVLQDNVMPIDGDPYYSQLNAKPYVIVNDQLPNGYLDPGETSGPIYLFFSNPQKLIFSYTTKLYGYPNYSHDISNQVDLVVGQLLGGVTSVSIRNKAQEAIQGVVRIKVKSVTIDGVVHTSDLVSLMQTENGVSGGLPYQVILDSAGVINQGESKSMQMGWNISGAQSVSFSLAVESIYTGLPIKASLEVITNNVTRDDVNKKTSYSLKIKNNSQYPVVSPLIAVATNVPDDEIFCMLNPAGYIGKKPFAEVVLNGNKLLSGATTPDFELVFNDVAGAQFTPVFQIQAKNMDDTPPVTSHDYAKEGSFDNSDSVTINFTAVDESGGSGVKETRYSVNNGQYVVGNQLVLTEEGEHIIKYWSVDNAGNEELQKEISVRLDRTKPQTTSNYTGEGSWQKDEVNITLSATDNLSGIKNTKYKVDGGLEQVGSNVVISTAGAHVLVYWSEDNAGNIEEPKTIEVKLDALAPVTSHDYAKEGSFDNSDSVTINFTAVDESGGSGVKETRYSVNNGQYVAGNQLVLTEEGEHIIKYWSVDNAGNEESKKEIIVRIDRTKPQTTSNYTGDGSWQKDEVNITLSATDNLSGIKNTKYKIDGGAEQVGSNVVISTAGAHVLVYWSEDNAGNTEEPKTIEVKLDALAPVTSHDYAKEGSFDNSDSVTINFTAVDESGGSGVKETRYSVNNGQYVAGNQVIISAEGLHFIKYWSVDNAGNEELQKEISVRLDRTKPQTASNYTGGAMWRNGDVNIIFSAIDNLSGIKHTKYTIDGGVEQIGDNAVINVSGEHTLTYWSEDNAGNIEEPKTIEIKLDKDAPQTNHDYDGKPVEGSITVNFTASDLLSGVKSTKYQVNGGTVVSGTSVFLIGLGNYNVSYWSEDNAGNIEQSKVITVKLISAPVIIVESPANGFITTNEAVDIVGTLDNGQDVTVSVGNVVGNVSGNQFEVLNVPLGEGEVYYTVLAENSAGLKRSVYLKITKDTTPPAVSITSPVDASVTASDTVDITGNVLESGSKLYREVLGGDDEEITLGADGSFSIADYPLIEGLNEIVFYGIDSLGNNGKTKGIKKVLSVTRDITAPDMSIEVALYDNDGMPKAYQAVSGSDVTLYNQVGKLDLRGVVNDKSATVKINNEVVSLDNDGKFSKTGITLNLAEGQSGLVTVIATDPVLNFKRVNINIIKDTVGPEIFVTSFVSGNVTLDSSPQTLVGVARGTTSVKVGAVDVPVVNERFEMTGWVLSEGRNDIEIIGFDSIGNKTKIIPHLFLDTTAPSAVVVTSPQTPHYTNKDRFTIKGSGEPNAVLSITGGALDISSNLGISGLFTQNVFVTAGAINNIKLKQTDKPGNVSPETTLSVIQDSQKPELTLLSPKAGQVDANSVLVSGSASDNRLLDANVIVDVLNNAGTNVANKSIAVVNGQFSSLIALPQGVFGNYTFKIKVLDKAGNDKTSQVMLSYVDVLDTQGPDIVVTYPKSGGYVNKSSFSLTGTCIDRSGVAELKISKDNSEFVPVSHLDNDGSFSHTVTLDNDGPHTLKLRALDANTPQNSREVTISFIVDTVPPITAPVVSGITPGVDVGGGQFLTNSDLIRIIGSYEPGFKVKATSIIESVEAVVAATGIYQIDIHISKTSPQNAIEVVGVDMAGNLSTDTNPNLKVSLSVSYDGVSPQVTNISPLDNASNVPLSSPITVTFSEPIQRGSLSDNQGNKIYAVDQLNTKYAGTISAVAGSNNTVFLLSLASGSLYKDSQTITVTVASGIKDLAGNSLKNNFVSRFKTVDITPPSVPLISQVLPSNLTNASSVRLLGTTEANAQIIVYRDNDTVVTGTANSSGAYDISVSLLANIVNNFRLKSKDASGNTSGFSVVVAVTQDGVLPAFVSSSPVADSQNIPKNSVFEIKFSEKLQQSTINSGFSITGKSNRVIAGTITIIPNDAAIAGAGFRFTPSSLLIDGEVIKIKLTSAIKDMAGNGLDVAGDPAGYKLLSFGVVDNLAPVAPVIGTVAPLSPTNQSNVVINGTVEAGAFVVVNGGNLIGVQQFLSDNDTGVFQITVPLKPNYDNVIAIKAKDRAGNFSPASSVNMYCDQQPPTMTSVMPKANDPLPVSGIFTVVFNEAVKSSTLASSILLMQDANIVPINISTNDSKNIITLTPKNALDMNLPYMMVIKQSLTDLAGNSFQQETTINYLSNDRVIPSVPQVFSVSEISPTKAVSVIISGGANDLSPFTKVQALDANMNLISPQTETYRDNEGRFSLNVPLALNKLNVINIVSRRPSGNKSEPVKIEIYQDSQAPVITIFSPQESVVLPSDTITLVAKLDDASSISSCTVNGEEKFLNIDANKILNTSLTGVTNGQVLNIIAKDRVGNTSSASITVSISLQDPANDTAGPVIMMIAPDNDADIDGTTINASGTVADANEISAVKINGFLVTTPTSFPSAGSLFDGVVSGLVDGVNLIKVEAWDTQNNMSQKTLFINVDVAPPSIVIHSPLNEAVFTESNINISGRVTDSNGISKLTLNGNDVNRDNEGNFNISYKLNEGENSLSFEVTDVADNVTSKELVLYYDVIGPEVKTMYPGDGASGLPTSTPIYAEFSERLDPVTVTYNTVKLFYIDSNTSEETKEITGNVRYDVKERRAYFEPSLLLEPGSMYRFKILAGIKDLVGFDLQSAKQSVFTLDPTITVISGAVIDPENGKGIHNATVRIIGTDIVGKTDEMGGFYIQSQNIPSGEQLLSIDGSTAILPEGSDPVEYMQNLKSCMIVENQVNSYSKPFYLPRVVPQSTEYINGSADQDVTFNDTVNGSMVNRDPIPNRFNMHVPAGALEFPTGATSGALSACIIDEQYLPRPEAPGMKTSPVVSAVWFHPFGVKCNQPVNVKIPLTTDRGEITVAPGDKFVIVSYSSETGDWETVGVGTVTDDSTSIVLEAGKGLKELTIVAIVPLAVNGPVESELREKLAGYGGSNESDIFLLELMVTISIMTMFSPVSYLRWRVASPNIGNKNDFLTSWDPSTYHPMMGVGVSMSAKSGLYYSEPNGIVNDWQVYPIFPSLIWLMILMSLEYPVMPTAEIQYTNTSGGGFNRTYVTGVTQWHNAFGGTVNSTWAYKNATLLRIDSWAMHGNVRFLGDDGAPTGSGGIVPWVDVYSDVLGLDAETPVRGFKVNQAAPYENNPQMGWVLSYKQLLKGCAPAWAWRYGHLANAGSTEYTSYGNSRSFINPNSTVRVALKGGSYLGETYTKAPKYYTLGRGGVVGNIDIYGNVSLGKLNISAYANRTFERDGMIINQIIPHKGLAKTTDTFVGLQTGIAMSNGDKAPNGGKVWGRINGNAFPVKTNGDSAWSLAYPEQNEYKFQASDKSSFDPLLYINLQATQTGTASNPSSQPAVTRPAATVSTSGRGVYIATPATTAPNNRTTPISEDQGRQEYIFYVVSTILFNNISDHSDVKVTYIDWTNWYGSDKLDPNKLPAQKDEDLFAKATGEDNIKIQFNHLNKMALKVKIAINKPAYGNIVVKISQTGTPYLLGSLVKPDLTLDATAKNITPLSKTLGQIYFILDPSSIEINLFPPPDSFKGNKLKLQQYHNVASTREQTLIARYWTIEIIDTQTMKETESQSEPTYTDNVYNQLEKMTIKIVN